jgi:hypothetical protein
LVKIFKANLTFWNGEEKKRPFHKGCPQEAHGVEREANVPSGPPMEKPNERTMANTFYMENEVLRIAVDKPPISTSVYRASDSDDEATINMDVELATTS